MKIGDGPKLPPLPLPQPGGDPAKAGDKAVGKTLGGFPDVAKTPTPGGPVPIPYPNAGDSFERAKLPGPGALFGRSAEVEAAKQRIEDQKAGAMTQFAMSLASAVSTLGAAAGGVAGAAAQGALQAVTAAAVQGGGGAVEALLTRAGQAAGAPSAGGAANPEALVDRVIGEAAKLHRADLVLYGDRVQELQGLAETVKDSFAEGGGDAIGDLAQEMQLEMQQLADQQAKLMEMLSSIMKKMSETSQGIVQNLR